MPERDVVITYKGTRYPEYTGRKFRLRLDVPEGYELKPEDVAELLERKLERLRATEEAWRAQAPPSLGELVAEALNAPNKQGSGRKHPPSQVIGTSIVPALAPTAERPKPPRLIDLLQVKRSKPQPEKFPRPVQSPVPIMPPTAKEIAQRAAVEAGLPKATPQQMKKVSKYFSPTANWLGFRPTTPQQYLDAAKSAVREGYDLYTINKWMEGHGLSAATRAYILKEVSPIVDLETSGDLATQIYREGSFFLWRLSQFAGAVPRFLGQLLYDIAVVNSEYSGPNTWVREAVQNTTGIRGVKPTKAEVKQAEKRLKDVAKGLGQDIRTLLPHKGWTKDMEEWYRRDSIVGPAVTLAILLDGLSLAMRGTGQAVGAAAERTLNQAIERMRRQPVKAGTPLEVQEELAVRAIVNVIRERLSAIEKRDVSEAEVLERIRGKSKREIARMLHPTAKTVAEGLEKAGYSTALLTRFVSPMEWLRMTEEQFVIAMEKMFGIPRDVWERYWQEASAARQRAEWAKDMKAKATGGTPPPTEQPPSGQTWAMEPPKELPAPERPPAEEAKAEPPPETPPSEEPTKAGMEAKPTEEVPPAEGQIPRRMDLRPEQTGTENLSYTAKNTQVRTQWAVVEIDDLEVSHNPLTWHENPDYPQVLQPRDRSAAAMQQQVKEIAQNLVPEKLGESASTSGGAPIVGEDGIVESGNGRTLALWMAYRYNPSAAAAYRRWLLENAERFGINPAVVEQLRHPVLVRIRPVEGDVRARASLALEMGLSDVAQFSPVDRAMADARIIEKHINLFNPDYDLDAKQNKEFVDAVLNDMPTSEVSQLLLSGGELSLTGIDRLYAGLLAYGYGSPALLAKLESPDLEVVRVAKAVAAAAPDIAVLRAYLSDIRSRNPEAADAYDIGNDIAEAVLWMERLRKGGRKVREFIEQAQLFGGEYAIPRTVKVLLVAFDRLRSIKAIRSFLKTYADIAGRAAKFAAEPDESLAKQLLEPNGQLPDKEKILTMALRQAEGGGTASLFDEAEAIPELPTAEELPSGIQQTEQKEPEPEPTEPAAETEQTQPEPEPTEPAAETEQTQPEAKPTEPAAEEEESARRGGKGGKSSGGAGEGVYYREEVPPIPHMGEGAAGRGEHPQGIILRLGRWIRVGRTPKRALGYYDPRTADVVIRRWGDIPTAAHEVAHAIDDEFGILAEWAEPRKHSPFDEELFAFLPEHRRKRGRLRDRRAEGFAHWFEAYVLNPEVAAGAAPNFYAHLQMSLPRDLWEAIEAWAQEIRNWVYSPAGEKIRAQFTFEKPKPEHIPDTFRVHWVDQLVRIFIDDRWPAIKAWREAKRRRGLHPRPSEDFELLISLWAGRYGKFVEMLHHGVPADQQGQQRSVPFIDMLRELDTSSREAFIQDAYDLFAFMGAQRAIELMERKEAQAYNKFRSTIGLPEKEEDAHDPSDIERWLDELMAHLSDEDAERIRAAWIRVQQSLESEARRITGWGGGILRDDDIARDHLETLKVDDPERYERLRRIARMYREIADHVLRYAVSTGRITQEQYDAIKASNQYYVDFHRVFGWEAPRAEVSRSGRVSRVSAITWEIQGSSRRIHNPLVSLMESIARAIAECDRNYALAQFVNALQLERDMYEGEPTLLADIGRPVNGPNKNAILVFRNGEGKWWEFHPEVLRAFNAWQSAYASDGWNIFAKLWGAVARLAYEGITKHPRFLVGNVVRDTLERLVRSPFRPARAKRWQRHWWQFFGGSHAGFLHLQREDYYAELERLMDELVRDRRFWVLPVRGLKRLWHWYVRMAEASEEFGRLNEFASAQRYAQETLGYSGWEAMLFAAFASRRYMDFRVAGSLVRVLNRLVPFTSASVRALSMGVDALLGAAGGGGGKKGTGGDVGAEGDMPWHYRRWGVEGMVTDSHRAWSAWLRLLLFVAVPSIMVYLWNNRDEDTGREYREFPPYLRYMFWLVHTPFGWVSIWKPYEFGLLGSIFEAAIEGDMENWAKALSRVALPLDEGDLALGFAGIVGAVANYDFFRGRWIVPPIEERRALKDTRGRWARDVYAASPLAQALGSELNVDPRKVDYLLRTQFGHAGAMLGEASRMASGERTLWDFLLWQFGTKRELTPYTSQSVQKTLDTAAQTGRESKVRGLRELIERWYRRRARGASTQELRPLLQRIIRMAGRQQRKVSRPFRSKVRPPR